MQRPLEYDAAIRPNAPTPLMVKSYREICAEAAGSKQKRYLILKLLDELKYAAVGPGAYNPTPLQAAPCTVIYRPHSADSRKLPEWPTPGPDYYYSKDDLIRPQAVVHKFGTEARVKRVRKEDLDMRPDLEPNMDAIKPKVQGTTIAPEQTTRALLPDEQERLQ